MKLPLSHQDRREVSSAAITQTFWLMLACSGLFLMTAYASDPAWWSSRGATSNPMYVTNGTIVTTNSPNSNAVVVEGQLKQFTARAVDEMNAHLTNSVTNYGAGATLNALMTNWAGQYTTGGYNGTNHAPIDYRAVNAGQVRPLSLSSSTRPPRR